MGRSSISTPSTPGTAMGSCAPRRSAGRTARWAAMCVPSTWTPACGAGGSASASRGWSRPSMCGSTGSLWGTPRTASPPPTSTWPPISGRRATGCAWRCTSAPAPPGSRTRTSSGSAASSAPCSSTPSRLSTWPTCGSRRGWKRTTPPAPCLSACCWRGRGRSIAASPTRSGVSSLTVGWSWPRRASTCAASPSALRISAPGTTAARSCTR